jgi:magnesium transporter
VESGLNIESIFSDGQVNCPVTWIDVTAHSSDDLQAIASRYDLPDAAVLDCLEPEHFPKFEIFKNFNFLVLRSFDTQASKDADSVHELTRKIAIFERENFVLTIHRSDLDFFDDRKTIWQRKADSNELISSAQIVLSILEAVVMTFQKPVEANRALLESFELKVFHHQGDTFEEGYFFKRRASAFKRLLRMSIDILPKLSVSYPKNLSVIQDVRENSERLYAYIEDFHESVASLVGLQLALSNHRLTVASFKTNEVMRILTIFSVFFMPLNLVTGIYGMNFENMPELKWRFGYSMVLAFMILMTLIITFYFKKKGVLTPPSDGIVNPL